VFDFCFQRRLVAFAAVIGVGAAGCSGSRALLPGTGPAAESARSITHAARGSHPGAFTRLSSQPPVGMQMGWLMTDGSVLTQSDAGNTWYRYVPDSSGGYAGGTWSQVASLQPGYDPNAFASDVLADGRLVISGGEYNSPGNYDLQLVNLGAVYDPVKNTWTPLGHPNHWKWIGDSPSSVLPNKTLLLGDKLHKWDAYLNPKTLQWVTLSDRGIHTGKADWNAEEGWTLLADGTVLTADVQDAPNSEVYNPATNKWKSAGSTIVDLHSPSPIKGCVQYGPKPKDCYLPPGEIGPAILRPDGTVFYTGSNTSGYGAGHTAIYNSKSGTWSVGPDFPNGDNAGDSFAMLEPSGNVLVIGLSGALYEFNGTTFSQVGSAAGPPLLLPTGQILFFGYSNVVLYTPTGSPKSSWAPAISSSPSTVETGHTYKISGTQFNGLSQAMSYGDEFQNATNYPLVRITSNASGNLYYLRTHDHSTMGVATGKASVSTHFDVPDSVPSGSYSLVVVANGIASKPVSVTLSGSRSRNR
jgi:hypothetical protein